MSNRELLRQDGIETGTIIANAVVKSWTFKDDPLEAWCLTEDRITKSTTLGINRVSLIQAARIFRAMKEVK